MIIYYDNNNEIIQDSSANYKIINNINGYDLGVLYKSKTNLNEVTGFNDLDISDNDIIPDTRYGIVYSLKSSRINISTGEAKFIMNEEDLFNLINDKKYINQEFLDYTIMPVKNKL